jgi:hypothetical protein
VKRKDGDPVWSTNAWIADSDRSMGLAFDGDVRAVPIKMLNSHEIDQNLEKTPATSGKMKMAHFGAKNGFANLGERVDQGTSIWFALPYRHPATAAWMTSRPQDEVEFDDGELPGYMPVIVLGVLFMATSFWKKGRGQA